MRLRSRRFAALFAVVSFAALVACSGTPGTTSGGEGASTSSGGSGTSGESPGLGTPIVGGSSGEGSSNGGTSSGETPGTSGGTSSGTTSSGASGTSATGPRPECVAWANRHCTCLEKASAAAPDCRTKTAKGCEDAVTLCPKMLSWYTCSQTTCGNTCPNPGC